MKVLSLFDGMSCGMIALRELGIEVTKYVAYEIDKYAVQTSLHNFPEIEQKGDVFSADFTEYKGFDYLIGGSPCTYWSIAQTKNRETVASGMGWELFSQYVRALKEAQPKYFLYENNKSMSAAIRASITETFGFEPICINSALVSAQNRQRLYWCGIRQADGTYKKADIQQPADRGILLKDILETGYAFFDKSYTLAGSYYKGPGNDIPRMIGGRTQCGDRALVAEPVCVAQRGRYDESGKVFQHYEAQPTGKTNNLTTVSKDNLIADPVICRQVGRNPENPKSRVAGLPTVQMFEPRLDQKSGTLTTVTKDNLLIEPLRVNEATKAGYTEIQAGNCVDMAQPNSKTRRGRNMENKSNCLQTTNEFYQYLGSINAPIYEVKDGFITVKGNKYSIKLVDGFYIIRKLTVRECMRLQTVPEWYEWPVSKSQAYKMLGNGWTVEVIKHLMQGTLKNKVVEENIQAELF